MYRTNAGSNAGSNAALPPAHTLEVHVSARRGSLNNRTYVYMYITNVALLLIVTL